VISIVVVENFVVVVGKLRVLVVGGGTVGVGIGVLKIGGNN